MAQVETQSAFRHSSQHNNYYYHPSTSPSHSGSSSSSNSHNSSPRSATIVPQRYCSPTQYYEDQNPSYQQHSPVNPTYRCTYSQQQSSRAIEEDNADNGYNPFPAYEHAMPSHTPLPAAIEDEDEEEDYEELEEEDEAPLESPNSLKSSSPSAIPHISDDIWTERGPGPSRQVDYLSHDWTEPDIWSSWRYVRKEKAGYPQNAARLENASWRTWAKSKYKLKTITPETLNWLKDCDVTWLYGPLQSQGNTLANSLTKVTLEPISPAISEPDMQPSRSTSRSSSFSAPSKPILKKRSHSEVMLTTLSGKTNGNLLSRAAQAVQDERRRELEEQELREEQRKNPLTPAHVIRSHQRMRRKGSTDITTISRDPESPFTVSQDTTSRHTSIVEPARTDYFGTGHWTSSSSGGQTPSTSKHIHFNDRVEQCIAVDVKDDYEVAVEDDESEDEGLFMGKAKQVVAKPEQHYTIAKLPATRLRPGDEPIREPPQVAFNLSPPIRQSPSRQSKVDSAIIEPSGFYYDEGGAFSSSASPPDFPPTHYSPDEENADDFSFDHPFASQSISENISNNSSAHTSTASSRRSSNLSFDLEEESQRRASVAAIPIPSAHRAMNTRGHGGLMGEEEDEEGMGFVGLAADAISTAKDLVGVLWNAGWGGRR